MSKMTPHKRAVAVTGTYTDRNGSEKKRYTTIGTLFRYDDGNLSLKIDAVPVGQGWNGFVSFYDLEERKTGSETSTGTASPDLNDAGDIPF
jgi:hypothetical protein